MPTATTNFAVPPADAIVAGFAAFVVAYGVVAAPAIGGPVLALIVLVLLLRSPWLSGGGFNSTPGFTGGSLGIGGPT